MEFFGKASHLPRAEKSHYNRKRGDYYHKWVAVTYTSNGKPFSCTYVVSTSFALSPAQPTDLGDDFSCLNLNE